MRLGGKSIARKSASPIARSRLGGAAKGATPLTKGEFLEVDKLPHQAALALGARSRMRGPVRVSSRRSSACMRHVLSKERTGAVEERGRRFRANDDDAVAASAKPVQRRTPDRAERRLARPRLGSSTSPCPSAHPSRATAQPFPGRLPGGDVDEAITLIGDGDEERSLPSSGARLARS